MIKKAQSVFNRWIRERDRHAGCISCGGVVRNAGHYFPAGHYTALRFNEINCNGQCVRCNRYLSGNLIHYRAGLIRRYGEKKVLELEQAAAIKKTKKWSRYELKKIIEIYAR